MSKKGATRDFFSFLQQKNPQKWTIFSYQTNKKLKKKEEKLGRPTGHSYGHPLDRKQTFFVDSLTAVSERLQSFVIVSDPDGFHLIE